MAKRGLINITKLGYEDRLTYAENINKELDRTKPCPLLISHFYSTFTLYTSP